MYMQCERNILCKDSKNELKKCGNCLFETFSKLYFLGHFCEAKKKGFECGECYQILLSRQGLRNHSYFRHVAPNDQTWLKCNVCNFKTLMKDGLTKHTLRKHASKEEISRKSHKCDQCDYANLKKCRLETHVKRMHSNVNHLKRRTRKRYTTEGKIQCETCKIWIMKDNLTDHISREHTNPMWKYKCEICAKAFNCKRNLYGHHLRVHLMGKKEWITCPYCDFKTLYKKGIERHLFGKHQEGREGVKCDSCDIRFFNAGDLKKHIYFKHTIDENIHWFTCDLCDYKTKYKRALDQHTKTHMFKSKGRKF